MKTKAFTLVEIMITVAIITVVIAITVPALVKMRQRAEREVCIANLRSISVAKKIWYIDYPTGTAQLGDLVPDYIRHTPLCPGAGTYVVGDLDDNPACNIEGHTL